MASTIFSIASSIYTCVVDKEDNRLLLCPVLIDKEIKSMGLPSGQVLFDWNAGDCEVQGPI